MIGIIGAMAVEVENLLKRMEGGTSKTVSGIAYRSGKIAGTDCVVARCGVGKVAAAVCAQTMILNWSPEAVVNVGVAGGIGKGIHIGDVVVSTGLVQHDMDTSALGDPKGRISGLNLTVIPASRPLEALVLAAARGVYGPGKVHAGVVATGDQFISDADRLGRIAREFGACACEMEGGSIAQVCYMNGVPFVAVRVISDNADEKAAVDFSVFAARSAHKTADLVVRILPKIGRPEP